MIGALLVIVWVFAAPSAVSLLVAPYPVTHQTLVALLRVDPSFKQWMIASYPKRAVVPVSPYFSTPVVSVQAAHAVVVAK